MWGTQRKWVIPSGMALHGSVTWSRSSQLNFMISSLVIHLVPLEHSQWRHIRLLFARSSWVYVGTRCGRVTTHIHSDRVWFTPLLSESAWFIPVLAVAVTLKQTLLQYECWLKKKETPRLRLPLRHNRPSSSALIHPEPTYSLSPAACDTHNVRM